MVEEKEQTVTPEEEEEEAVESTEEPCCSEEAEVKSEEGADTAVEEKGETEEAEAETPTVKPFTFSWSPPMPEKVFIAGTFNDWNPCSHELTRSETGGWEITLDLEPGTYEYKLIVDVKWIIDPTCEKKVKNPHGSYNSVLTVE